MNENPIPLTATDFGPAILLYDLEDIFAKDADGHIILPNSIVHKFFSDGSVGEFIITNPILDSSAHTHIRAKASDKQERHLMD